MRLTQMRQRQTAHILIRIGVAFTLLYAAYSGFTAPSLWIGYVPDLDIGVSREILLEVWGVLEIVLGVWIISGWAIRVPTGITAIAMVVLILLNLPQFSVLFRDVAIALSALALFVWPVPILAREEKMGVSD